MAPPLRYLVVVAAAGLGGAFGAVTGLLASGLVLGVAARTGEMAGDLAIYGVAGGGLAGAVAAGLMARRLSRGQGAK